MSTDLHRKTRLSSKLGRVVGSNDKAFVGGVMYEAVA